MNHTKLILNTEGLDVTYVAQEQELILKMYTDEMDIERGLLEVHASLMLQGQTQLFADEFCQRAYKTLATMLAMEMLRSRIKY